MNTGDSAVCKAYWPIKSVGISILLALGGVLWNAQAEEDVADLTELSLEDLMNIEVTSVSKQPEKKQAAAAAVYVITEKDIRRSGATTIPDLLRTVPGLHVAELNASTFSVTSRGFSGQYANKLLILIDGRSAYTPIFSGIYWQCNDVLLKDIDRIEVIRGPGGTLWGANAVNGVINIVTKHAKDTQGLYLESGIGTDPLIFGAFRYGAQHNEDLYYRVYGQARRLDEREYPSGKSSGDNWYTYQGGFRLDWSPSSEDALTLQGDAFQNELHQPYDLSYVTIPYRSREDKQATMYGGNLLGRWRRTISEDEKLALQCYYDLNRGDHFNLDHFMHTFDLDFDHTLVLNDMHTLIWGLGYRLQYYDMENTELAGILPDVDAVHLFSAFVQDQVDLIKEKLRLTVGFKLEHNDFTGIEFQPNVRLAWQVTPEHTLWTALSHAVRTPSLIEDRGYLRSTTFPRIDIALRSDDMTSEDLYAFELGYRGTWLENLTFDCALFYNKYENLRTIEFALPRFDWNPLRLTVPFTANNNMEGETYGIEVALNFEPYAWWRIRTGYTLFEMDLDAHPKTFDFVSLTLEGDTPEQQFSIQNAFALGKDVDLDLFLRYVDTLPTLDIDDYLTMDARLGWRPREGWEISLTGENLFDAGRTEYQSDFVQNVPTQVSRSCYLKVAWSF